MFSLGEKRKIMIRNYNHYFVVFGLDSDQIGVNCFKGVLVEERKKDSLRAIREVFFNECFYVKSQ